MSVMTRSVECHRNSCLRTCLSIVSRQHVYAGNWSALAMWRQFHVNRYSTRCTVAVATCRASDLAFSGNSDSPNNVSARIAIRGSEESNRGATAAPVHRFGSDESKRLAIHSGSRRQSKIA